MWIKVSENLQKKEQHLSEKMRWSRPRGIHVKFDSLSYTCPNWSGGGPIDKPDRSEQVFDQYDIPEDPEKIFHERPFDGGP